MRQIEIRQLVSSKSRALAGRSISRKELPVVIEKLFTLDGFLRFGHPIKAEQSAIAMDQTLKYLNIDHAVEWGA